VIRRRAIPPLVEATVPPLIRSEASIKTGAWKEVTGETMKMDNIKRRKTMDKGGIAIMKIQEIREIAIAWGVDASIGRSRKDVIRDVQVKEGNSPCFKTKETCENDCIWKADCLNKKQ
jgi:hypothetical protein